MKMTLHQMVLRFHSVAGIPIHHRPHVPPEERIRLRLRLITEEYFELLKACGLVPRLTKYSYTSLQGFEWNTIEKFILDLIGSSCTEIKIDLPEVADALTDMDYINEGTRLELGVDGASVLEEVHRANMNKFRECKACYADLEPQDGVVCSFCGGMGRIVVKREDGKVIKPDGWTPPNIRHVLLEQGWDPSKGGDNEGK